MSTSIALNSTKSRGKYFDGVSRRSSTKRCFPEQYKHSSSSRYSVDFLRSNENLIIDLSVNYDFGSSLDIINPFIRLEKPVDLSSDILLKFNSRKSGEHLKNSVYAHLFQSIRNNSSLYERIKEFFLDDNFSESLTYVKNYGNLKKQMYKWTQYINKLLVESECENVGFTKQILDYACQLVDKLNIYFIKGLSFPSACPGNSNNFVFVWNKNEHYLECEIFDSEAVEFFYKNRMTNEIWGEDITISSNLTGSIFKKLDFFVNSEG